MHRPAGKRGRAATGMRKNQRRAVSGKQENHLRGLLKTMTALCILVCAGGFAWMLVYAQGNTVGSINGYDITHEEYTQAMNGNIASITAAHAEKYEESTPREFWGTAGDEKEPLKELQKETQSDLTKRYVLFGAAREYGLIEDIDYASLKEALEDENANRADPERITPIYGPALYSFSDYLTYLSSGFTTELITLMQEDGTISVAEEEVLAAYEENPILLGSRDPSYRILEASKEFAYGQEPAEKETARMAAVLGAGEAVPEDAQGWSVSERTIDENNYREVSRMEPEMLEVLAALEAGEVSPGIVAGHTCFIYKMVGRTEAEPLPYEEIKGLYEKRLAEEKFAELLAEMCREAEVSWEEEKFPQPGGE